MQFAFTTKPDKIFVLGQPEFYLKVLRILAEPYFRLAFKMAFFASSSPEKYLWIPEKNREDFILIVEGDTYATNKFLETYAEKSVLYVVGLRGPEEAYLINPWELRESLKEIADQAIYFRDLMRRAMAYIVFMNEGFKMVNCEFRKVRLVKHWSCNRQVLLGGPHSYVDYMHELLMEIDSQIPVLKAYDLPTFWNYVIEMNCAATVISCPGLPEYIEILETRKRDYDSSVALFTGEHELHGDMCYSCHQQHMPAYIAAFHNNMLMVDVATGSSTDEILKCYAELQSVKLQNMLYNATGRDRHLRPTITMEGYVS